MSSIGERIREIRGKISQEKFAEKKVILNLKYKKEGVFSV